MSTNKKALQLRFYTAVNNPENFSVDELSALKQEVIELAKSGDEWARDMTPEYAWNPEVTPPKDRPIILGRYKFI